MNLHKTADDLVAAIGGLYGDGTKFFRESTAGPPLSEVIAGTSVMPPHLEDLVELCEEREFETPATFGEFTASARFTALRWNQATAPTLIYHHGSGESNYTARIRRIVDQIDRVDVAQGGTADPRSPVRQNNGGANIIVCSIPYNRNLKEYLAAAGRLDRWVFVLAASVRLTEVLTARLVEQGCARVVCAGISLGGWITNLHHTYFDTCDAYCPIFAGAALDDLFTESIYRKLLSSAATGADEQFRGVLNFEADFTARGNGNVYPVMARHDQFIRFDRQAGIYRPEQMTVLERSHTTGAVAYKHLARHLGTYLYDDSAGREDAGHARTRGPQQLGGPQGRGPREGAI
mgnify:CR=1 FL=1